jgi:hypothetical protein
MRTLQITLYSFGAQFSFVEWEFVPGFVSDHLIVFDQELNPALLTAKTAMGFYYQLVSDEQGRA